MFGLVSPSEIRKVIAIIYGGKKTNMSEDLKCSFKSSRVAGQINFYSEFNRTPTPEEVSMFPTVNLSRGAVRPYRIDQLDVHNGNGA